MNDESVKKKFDQSVTLDNEATPDSAVLVAAAPAATTTATSDIAPDEHFLSWGLKLYTELFSKGNIKNMADKYTVDDAPYPKSPDAPNDDTSDSAAQDAGPTNSNSPNSLRNRKFAPYSTNTMKTRKRRERKLMIKLQSTPPLP